MPVIFLMENGNYCKLFFVLLKLIFAVKVSNLNKCFHTILKCMHSEIERMCLKF